MSQAVVQAAQQVAQVQNRFQNLGGQVAKGMQIVEAKNQKRRAAREKAVRDRLKESRRKIKELDNNINTLGFSDEETKIIKDMSVKKTDRFYELQGELAQFENPRSREAQEIVDEMNNIRNWFTNVNNQQKQRVKQREDYKEDLEAGLSSAAQNKIYADNAQIINTGSFTAIDDVSGEFLWGEPGSYMGLASGTEYFMNPGELFELIDQNHDMATKNRTQPLTSGQVDRGVTKFRDLVEDKNTLAALLASGNPVAKAYGNDLREKFEEAYESGDEEALKEVTDQVVQGYETYLRGINNKHIEELKANEEPDAPSDNRVGAEKSDAYYRRKTKKALQNDGDMYTGKGGIVVEKSGDGYKLYTRGANGVLIALDGTPTAASLREVYNALGI